MLSTDVYNIKGKALLAVGASTAICSVIGFDLSYRVLRVDGQPLQSRRVVVTLIYLFIISVMPGVDFYGHFGSLLGGFLIGMVALKPDENGYSKGKRRLIKVGGIVMLSVYIVALVSLLIKYHM